MAYETVTVLRDCEALQIPSGAKVKISKGSQVQISQSLGGNYTVILESGYMATVRGVDADALGKEARKPAAGTIPTDKSLEELVWDQLRTCYDPEIPVNIVDLGLVYECRITAFPEGGSRVEVKMTLTAPGCGMGGSIATDAESKILSLPGVKEARVEVVWDPPWDQTKMSEAAKLKLGML